MSGTLWVLPATAVLAYVLLGAVLFVAQRRLIYLSQRYPQRQMEARRAGLGLCSWPSTDADPLGFVHRDGPADPLVDVLVFHGNAGSALDRTYYITDLEGLGCRVVLCEYPGYGAMPGRPTQKALIDAGIRAARAAYESFGRPPVLLGESLGAAVAAAVAGSGKVQVQGAILITPWDSLPELAQRLYWYLPARWFVLDRYDNVAALCSFDRPVAIVMAERDQIVPACATLRLYESLQCPKRIWRLSGVGHDNWLAAVDRAWWAEVLDFVRSQAQVHPVTSAGSRQRGRQQTIH